MTIPPEETPKPEQGAQTPPPSDGKPSKPELPLGDHPLRSNHRGWALYLFTLALIIVGLAGFLLWFLDLQFCVTTDDAYANGNKVSLNPSIPGSVIAFYADDTDLVIQGQLLVELDPTYYEFSYQKALARLAAQAMELSQLSDDVLVNQAMVDIKKVMQSKARFDYDNRSQLIDAKAISHEDFIHSQEDLTIAENELRKAEYQLKLSQDALGLTSLETHPLIEEKKGEVREAYYYLKCCKLYAPVTGYVAQRSVNVGQSVTPTTDLLAIIPTEDVWVEANFKETELTYMRIGQPATVWFDLYGSSVKYQGHVLGIASGSGSIFSLIPPQNATGNWIKIVQRLPVRISLDPEKVKQYPTRLGISAQVKVDITHRDLPMLAQVPSSKPLKTTTIYEMDLDEIEAIMHQVIQKNLYQPPLKQ